MAGKFFVIGGNFGGRVVEEVLEYNPEANTWSRGKDLPQARRLHAAVAVGRSIYVLGGHGHGGLTSERTVFVLDVEASRAWESKAPMQECRRFLAAVAADGGAIAIGGQDDQGKELASAEKLDQGTGHWSLRSPMQGPRAGLAAVNLHGTIFAIGGTDRNGASAAVERFDLKEDAWRSMAPMQEKRKACAACIVGDKIIVAGGANGYDISASVELMDPHNGAWEYLPHMQAARMGHSSAAAPGCAYIFGGSNGRNTLHDAERWDPEANTWSEIKDMSQQRTNAAAVAIGFPEALRMVTLWLCRDQAVSCIGMSGDELAHFTVERGTLTGDLRTRLAQHLGCASWTLQLLLPNGTAIYGDLLKAEVAVLLQEPLA